MFSQADIALQAITHPGTSPGYTLLQEIEEICHRDPIDLYDDPDDYNALVAENSRDELRALVETMRHTHLAQAIGAALSSTMSTHVTYAYSQADRVLSVTEYRVPLAAGSTTCAGTPLVPYA